MPSARGEGGGAEEAPLLPASSSSSGAAVVLKATSGAVAAPRSPDADIEAKKSVLRLRWLLGVAYMMAMGVCGVVLVALGSTLEVLAAHCGTTATAIGTVFIARGAGAICGALASSWLYAPPMRGNSVMVCTLAALAALLVYLPFVSDLVVLHACFGGLGLCTAITDTGCQIMTRKVHGVEAGPWLGANTVVFGIAGALVPLVDLLTTSLRAQYVILTVISLLVGLTLIACPSPDEPRIAALLPRKNHAVASAAAVRATAAANGLSAEAAAAKLAEAAAADASRSGGAAPSSSKGDGGALAALGHYSTEFVIGVMVFWLIGGKVTSTAYVEDYVEATGIVPASDAAVALLVLWVMITVGRLGGLHDQIALKGGSGAKKGGGGSGAAAAARDAAADAAATAAAVGGVDDALYSHLTAWLLTGAAGMLLMLVWPDSPLCFWLGLALYGLGNGPCIGYCYDLNNRLTVPSETGMAVVMFGLNFGASLVPYGAAVLWDHTVAGPYSTTVVVLVSMLIPVPLLHLTRVTAAVRPAAKAPPPAALADAGPSKADAVV